VFWFENGGSPVAWIGSADLMHRNLDRRVEVLVKLPGGELVDEVRELLDTAFADDIAAWQLGADGAWRRTPEPGVEAVHLQEFLIERQRRRVSPSRRS
jgi:polyphosphate kinase